MIVTLDSLTSNPPQSSPSLIGSGLLPEHGLMLLVAQTGVGKSVLLGRMCMDLVLKNPLFDARKRRHDKDGNDAYFPVNEECKILYLDTEVGAAGLYNRMTALKAACNCPSLGNRFELVTEHNDSLLLKAKSEGDRGFANLKKIIGDCKPPVGSSQKYVVIFDPLGDFHELDENDNSMRLVFQRIKALQHEFGFAAIISHHESDRIIQGQFGPIARKGTQKSRGSSCIPQVMDTIITLDVEDEALCGVANLRLEWAKVRHDQKPVTGMLMVDYKRMHVEWIGPCRGMGVKEKTQRRESYVNSLNLTPEE